MDCTGAYIYLPMEGNSPNTIKQFSEVPCNGKDTKMPMKHIRLVGVDIDCGEAEVKSS